MLRIVSNDPTDVKDQEQVPERHKRFQLAKLLQSTELILDHAHNGDWDSVEKLERLRQVELAACFAETDSSESLLVIEALATLLDMNQQITRLVEDAKQKLVDDQHAMKTRQSVALEYENSQ